MDNRERLIRRIVARLFLTLGITFGLIGYFVIDPGDRLDYYMTGIVTGISIFQVMLIVIVLLAISQEEDQIQKHTARSHSKGRGTVQSGVNNGGFGGGSDGGGSCGDSGGGSPCAL